MPIFVPERIKPKELFAENYTFNPKVMNGLFLWGQKSLLESRKRILNWLSWGDIDKLEQSSSSYRAAVKKLHEDVLKDLKEVDKIDWAKVSRERRAEMEKKLERCK